MTDKETNRDWSEIARPYNNFLLRSIDSDDRNLLNVGTEPSDDEATPANVGGNSGATSNGSVQEMAVKNDGAIGDVWIKNFIRSVNWAPKTRGFSIDGTTGRAEFTNVFISGEIEALIGKIGGWTIGANYIRDLAGVVGLSSAVTGGDDIRFWAGNTTMASAPFRVTEAGALVATSATITGAITASSGSIGSFTIGTYLYTGSKTAYNDANAGVHLGSDGIGIGNNVFTVSSTGALVATSATITGSITATTGTIGGWTIGATALSSTNLTLDSGNELIKSNDFVSGALGKGWQLGVNWAEFQNIYARGILRSCVFEYETISAIGGTFLISHDADKLNSNMGADDTDTAMITEGNVTFAVGDHLRMKTLISTGVDDEWLTVATVTDASHYVVTRDVAGSYVDGSNPEWTAGTAIVNFGQANDGGIKMTASESNAPHIDVYTINATPWNSGITTKMRMGNLNGFLGYTTDLYGIAIGEATKYLKYDSTNGLRIAGRVTISNPGDIVGSTITNDSSWTDDTLATTKTKCFYQAAIPISISIGDLWIDSDDGNKLYRAEMIGADQIIAGEWVAVPDNNKTTTFAQDGIPISLAIGDMWVDTNDENKLYRAASIGADAIIAGEWILVRDGSIAVAQTAADAAQVDATQAIADAATAQGTADGKVVTFYQTAAPAAEGVGDLWVDTDDTNKLYRWSGNAYTSYAVWALSTAYALTNFVRPTAFNGYLYECTTAGTSGATEPAWGTTVGGTTADGTAVWTCRSKWVTIVDTDIATAIADAATAQNTADGKIVTFYQAAIPVATDAGDFWVDTDDKNKLYRSTNAGDDQIIAGEWVLIRDTDIAQAIADADAAQATANARITTFFQAGIPTSLAAGDLWVDTDDKNKIYRAAIAGATTIAAGQWVIARDTDIPQAIADAATAQSTADGKIVTFYQSAIPVATDAGDLWVDTDDGKIYRATAAGDDQIIAGEWIRVDTGLYPALIDVLATTNAPVAAGADVTQTIIDGGIITTGYITLSTAGHIKSGQTAYETGTGFWLGSDGVIPKFSIGNATDYLKWDGTNVKLLCSSANAIVVQHGSDILLEHGGDIKFESVARPAGCTATLVATDVGNLTNGSYKYNVTFVNDTGETNVGLPSNAGVGVTVDATHKQVDLSDIEVSSSGSVTKRRIYRTKAGGSYPFFLAEIADNTTTTYRDNIADASLGVDATYMENSTFGKIFVDDNIRLHLATKNTMVGYNTGAALTTGTYNTALGSGALSSVTIGFSNTGVGGYALDDITTGEYNTGIGYMSITNNATGVRNTASGYYSLYDSTGDYCTAFGAYALGSGGGSNSIGIGYYAGRWETASNKFYLDAFNRGGTADEKAKSLMYGVMSETQTDQILRLTASVGINTIDFGSGKVVLALANATTVPSALPTGGGVIYCEGGALKYMGSSGTITTLGAA